MTNLANRLKYALKQSGKTRAELSNECNLSRAAISQWFSGEIKQLKSENLLNVANFLNVNPNWLVTGLGDWYVREIRWQNSTKKIKWGILGAARVNERLLPAIIEASNSELVAIASRRAGAAKTTLEKYAPCHQNVTCYDNMDALVTDKNVDAIYCPMANNEHAEWALKAINAGKHVLIEKPMALTVADIEALESAANKNNVKVMEGFMYRFHPQHARVKEIVKSGLIGDVLSCRASYSFLMRPARMYRIASGVKEGGGAMWDIGPYAIHSLRWCFGLEPQSVIAHAKLNEVGADIVTSGVLDFGNDSEGRARFGHFDISFERSRKSEYEIIGTKGWVKCHAAWVFQNDVPVISWALEDGKYAEERFAPSNHFTLEIEHFSDCVLNNKAPHLTFADAKANCKAIEAVLQSVATGSKISCV